MCQWKLISILTIKKSLKIRFSPLKFKKKNCNKTVKWTIEVNKDQEVKNAHEARRSIPTVFHKQVHMLYSDDRMILMKIRKNFDYNYLNTSNVT